ncbi:MAG: hypothetical protein JRC68_02440 [Deltaproteobacteria bacterium]|nr:hypothetical protein [Deltaproteobacteria bacterium]
MSLLDQGVFSSVSYNGIGPFRFDIISYQHKKLLKSIVKRQRSKYKKYDLVPWQLLQIFWEWGFLPGEEMPKEGMKIPVLLEFLNQGEYTNDRHRKRCEWLYERISRDRIFPDKACFEIFVKYGRKKWISVSQIRDMPGTIIR